MRNEYQAQTEDDNVKKLVRQEEFILAVTEALASALEQSGMSQSRLADKLGCTRGFVSQVLAGGRNLTLRTIADIALALDVKPVFSVLRDAENLDYELIPSATTRWGGSTTKIVLHPSAYAPADESERKQLVA